MDNKLLTALLVLLAVLMGAVAHADDFTARMLRDLCSQKNDAGTLGCAAFIKGYSSGHIAGTLSTLLRSESLSADADFPWTIVQEKYSLYCLPDDIKAERLADIFLEYIRQHPEKLHLSAGLQYGEALRINFPCGK